MTNADAGGSAGHGGQPVPRSPSPVAKGSLPKPGMVIRDSFTMPAADYELIGALKQRCIALGFAMKKSELLRAGLSVLHGLPDESLARAVAAVESVKTGRPPGKKKKKKHKKKKKKAHRNNKG
jgi:hypothetical protein